MFHRKYKAMMLIMVLLVTWLALPFGHSSAYFEGPYQSQPQLIYNPSNSSFLQVYLEQDKLVGQLLSINGEPMGDRHIYSNAVNAGYDVYDIAFDPVTQKYMLIWLENGAIVGAWLNSDGELIVGSTFMLNVQGNVYYFAPKIVYDSNAHQFAVAFMYDVSEYDLHMAIALFDPVTQSRADLQESVLEGYYFADYDIVYDESIQRYLVVWIDAYASEAYGKYIHWNMNQNESYDFIAETDHRLLIEDADYQIQAVYNPILAKTVIISDYYVEQTSESGLTVTSVTYDQYLPDVSVPIAHSLINYVVDFDVAYDQHNRQYALVWQDLTEDEKTVLHGLLLSDADYTVVTDFSSLAHSSSYEMLPSLTAVPDLGIVMLSFITGNFGSEYVVTLPFGEVYAGPPKLLLPIMSYDREEDQFLILSARTDDDFEDNDELQFSLEVRSMSGQGQIESAVHLETITTLGLPQFDLVYGDDQQHLAIWSQFNIVNIDNEYIQMNPVVYGQRLHSDGSLIGDPFLIAEDAVTPTVSYDSGSGQYLVAYIKVDMVEDQQPAVYVTAVNQEGVVNAPFPIANFEMDESLFMSVFMSKGFLQLEFDESRQLFELVWSYQIYDEENESTTTFLAGQTLKLMPVGDQVAFDLLGEQHYYLVEEDFQLYQFRTVYDRSSKKIHVAWVSNNGMINGVPATLTNNGPVLHESYYVEPGNWNFDLVYDDVKEQVLVGWLEQDEQSINRVYAVMQPIDSLYPDESELMTWTVAENVMEEILQLDISAVSTPTGPAMFYSIYTELDEPVIGYGLVRANHGPSVKQLLREIDGNPDNLIQITDIIRYIRQEQINDTNTVKSLLQYIESAYPVAF